MHCGKCYACADASPFARNLETEKALHQGGRALAQEAIPQDLWKWAHHVASAASSPSALQEALLEEGRKTAENLAGTAKEVPPFWSGHLHSRILSSISRLKRPSSILEIGSFVGISCRSPYILPRVHWFLFFTNPCVSYALPAPPIFNVLLFPKVVLCYLALPEFRFMSLERCCSWWYFRCHCIVCLPHSCSTRPS